MSISSLSKAHFEAPSCFFNPSPPDRVRSPLGDHQSAYRPAILSQAFPLAMAVKLGARLRAPYPCMTLSDGLRSRVQLSGFACETVYRFTYFNDRVGEIHILAFIRQLLRYCDRIF